MKIKVEKINVVSLVLLGISLILLAAAVSFRQSPGDTVQAARRLERRLSHRLSMLEGYVSNEPHRLPSDMILYRFHGDTICHWTNQFDVMNDELSARQMLPVLVNPRVSASVSLSDIRDTLAFYNFGSGWYLAKSLVTGDGEVVLIGLEILNQKSFISLNSVNPRLRLRERFSIKPLEFSGGTAVVLENRPQFKVLNESLAGSSSANAGLVWLAFAFLVASSLFVIITGRTVRHFVLASIPVLISIAAMYAWGMEVQTDYPVFSPTLYAGGRFLFSLGAVILVNFAIMFIIGGGYLVRDDVMRHMRKGTSLIFSSIALVAVIAAILVYTNLTLRSIIFNSGVTLEIYKLKQVTIWTGVLYLSFIGLLASVPLLVQFLQPAFYNVTGRHYDVLSSKWRVVWASLIALYLVAMSGVLGVEKERKRAEVWANRIAVDRDISLELHLRRMEGQIASDALIATMASFDNLSSNLTNRILDYYFPRLGQNYDVTVYQLGDNAPGSYEYDAFFAMLQGGTPISDGSHFLYSETGAGHSRYYGLFTYFVRNLGSRQIIIEVEPKLLDSPGGYSQLVGATAPGAVVLPAMYSYAHYRGSGAPTYRGSYAYPTELDSGFLLDAKKNGGTSFDTNGYTHFLFCVDEGEYVIISRPQDKMLGFIVSFVIVALLALASLGLLTFGRPRRKSVFEKSYFKPRILGTLTISLVLTMVAMVTVSVAIVYRSNDANLSRIISEKATAIQSMVTSGVRGVSTPEELRSPKVVSMLNEVRSNTSADITLFDTKGRIIVSTSPEMMRALTSGCRVDPEAYEQIRTMHRRYFLKKFKTPKRSYYNMYTPINDENGRMIAIMSSPYPGGETYLYERDVIMHSVTLLVVFILMFNLSRIATETIVDKMFNPLGEISRKISNTGLESLDYINYDRNDEISHLVVAYNRMVSDLTESTRKLAQAERDKAWSGMARQVAHEIKNPLTPMKLQLQRIIRLKGKGDPQWQEKFDEVSQVILDHIDILTDTANEFSTFAKLYSEVPTDINLDKLLQEEISMFDNREDVRFEYFGFHDSDVRGPKPQLTRVFVNLLGNSVQALEGMKNGRILVSLRKSMDEGYLDIVVEDNGPGVSPENVDKLFMPNFTTKSAGSGLGLAISRSILERCGATISYSRSFSLGGACFCIKYPQSLQASE